MFAMKSSASQPYTKLLGGFAVAAVLIWGLGIATLLTGPSSQETLPTQAVMPTSSEETSPSTDTLPIPKTEEAPVIVASMEAPEAKPLSDPISITDSDTIQPMSEPLIELPSADPVPQTAVIQFAPDTTEAERAGYLSSIGATVQNDLTVLDTVTVTLPSQSTFNAMSASEVVLSVDADYYVTALRDWPTRDPRLSEQWAMPAIHADAAWKRLPLTANAVTVAVIDSGICATHPDLIGRTVPGYDFIESDADPDDTFGHGCGVSGLIAANSDNDIGIAGLAPHVMIMPLRVLDGRGIGTYSDVAAAIVYAVDHGAQVINLSLGGAQTSAVLRNAVLYAQQQNVIVVAAAGNNSRDGALYPAAFDGVYSVGALDPNLQRSSFSNYGPLVRLYAPGRDLLTTTLSGDYGLVSGTSFAAPLVSAAAAIEYSLGDTLAQDGRALDFGALAPVPVTPVPTAATPALDNTESTTLTGWLSVNYGDPTPDSKEDGLVMVLLYPDNGTPLELVIPPGEASLYHGERVEVTGTLQSGAQSAQASGAQTTLVVTSIAAGGARAQAVTGSRPYANLMCRFSDVDDTPNSIASVQEMMLGDAPSVDHYWRELSSNRLNIVGTQTFGWFTLPHPRSYYVAEGPYGANISLIATDCAAAADADVDFSPFFGINFMVNQTLDCCAWGGTAFVHVDGEDKFFAATWLPPWAQEQAVATHEMGHAFGLPHSSGPSHNPSTELGIYVSAWDVMSLSGGMCRVSGDFGCVPPGTIGYHYNLLGWIDDRQVTVDPQTAQTITLDRLDQPEGSNTLLIRVPIDGSSMHFFTVEVRDLFGYDQNVPGQAVVIHDVDLFRVGNTGPALVVDADTNNIVNDEGAMWRVGEVFIDPDHNIAVRILSQTGSAFTVEVSNGIPLLPDAPINALVTSTTAFSVSLRWTDRAVNETGFKIYRGAELIGLVGANIKTYTDTSAVCGETLTYTVTAYNVAGESAPSNAVTTTTPPCTTLNDTPQTAYPIAAGLPYTITQKGIQAATTSSSEPPMTCLTSGRGYSHSVWYSFTPSVSQKIELSTVGTEGNYDTVIALYKGAPNNFTPIGCDDNSGGSGKSLLAPSAVLNAGTTYSIMIARKGAATTSDPLTLRLTVRTVVYRPTDAEQLINAVKQANASVQPDIIELAPNTTYTLTRRTEGLNALPNIASDLTIRSDASTAARPLITRTSVLPMRFVTVLPGVTLHLGKIKVSHGRLNTSSGGGAILNLGTLDVWDTEFLDNESNSGGAIRSEGTLTIRSSVFTGNTATNNGGAMYVTRGTATLTDTTFSDNGATFGGGLFNKGTAHLIRVTFTGNKAAFTGGGLLNQGSLTYQGGTLSGNTTSSGGAIANQGTSVLKDLRITANTAQYGGGIDNTAYLVGGAIPASVDADAARGLVPMRLPIDDAEAQGGGGGGGALGDLTLNNVILESNTADYGGALRTAGGTVTLIGVTVRSHTMSFGAIMNSQATMIITDGLFENNQALDTGGALYSLFSSVTINGSSIWRSNSAMVGSGGAIAAYDNLTIEGATFEHNTSGTNGGAILVGPNGSAMITNSRFLENGTYYQGGAIYTAGFLFMDEGGLYRGNSSSYGGGAIAAVNGPATINNARFEANRTEANGGALLHHVYQAPLLTNDLRITGSLFTQNTAYLGGAVYALSEGPETTHLPLSMTLTNDIFHFNQAVIDGGAIGTSYAQGSITDSCITANGAGSHAAVIHEGEMLDATDNWWGLAVGPNLSTGDTASGPINTSNFKTSAPEGCNISNDYPATSLLLEDNLPLNIVQDLTPADAGTPDPALPAGCLTASASLSHTGWWRYTPSHAGQTLDVDTVGSTFDTVLAVWKQGANGALTSVACNDNSGGPQSKLRLSNLNVDETYLLMVGAAQASANAVAHLNVSLPAPSNDDVGQASPVTPLPYRSSLNTEGATRASDDPTPSCATNTASTVWYRYTAPNNKPQTFTTEGSDYDTVIAIYTGTRGSLTEVACSDNISETDLTSRLTLTPQKGQTYLIMVAGSNGQRGSLTFGAPQSLGIPTLNAPNTPSTTDSQPTFTWTSVNGAARYDIQIDVNDSPVSAPIRVNGTSYKPLFPLLPRVYHWRVRAVDAQGFASEWSNLRTLIVTSPTNQAPNRNYFTTATPTLSWSRISGATTYEVQVDDAANFSSPVFTQVTSDSSTLSVITSPLPSGLYIWRVRARQANGSWSPWSSTDSFTLDILSGDA